MAEPIQTIPGVADNTLILTSWGQAVADELNDNCVKYSGIIGDGTETVARPGTFTGPVIINANPTLKLRRETTNQPVLQFEHITGTPVFGSITGLSTGLVYNAAKHLFIGGDIDTGLGGGVIKAGVFRGYSAIGGNFQVVDRDGGRQCNIHFYGQASSPDSLGTLSAIIGYLASDDLQINNELAGGNLALTTAGAGDINIAAGGDVNVTPGGIVDVTGDLVRLTSRPGNHIIVDSGTGFIVFLKAGVEQGRFDSGGRLLIGKDASGIAASGIELSGGDGQILGTVTTNVANVTLNRTGSADVDNGVFTSFRHNGTEVGKIHWESGTSHVVYSQTSDYRLKNDLGPVVDGLERIRLLKPRRVTRTDSPAPVEHDALIAHEVAEVIPNVVSGTKDAVAPAAPAGQPAENYPPEGSIVPQSLDYTGLITPMIAAIQDLAGQVDTLTARVATLEAA